MMMLRSPEFRALGIGWRIAIIIACSLSLLIALGLVIASGRFLLYLATFT